MVRIFAFTIAENTVKNLIVHTITRFYLTMTLETKSISVYITVCVIILLSISLICGLTALVLLVT